MNSPMDGRVQKPDFERSPVWAFQPIRIKKGLLIFYLVGFLAWDGLFSQNLGIYMMSRDQVFRGRNPAIAFNKNTIIGLPEFSGTLNQQTGSGTWLVKQPDGSRKLSLASGWEGMDRKNYHVEIDWGLRTFFIGKKFNRFQIGISHEVEGNTFVQFNKDLVGLLGFGNYGYLQKEPLAKLQPLDIKPEINNQIFNGFGVQFGIQFNHLSFGGSLRYLSGLQELHTDIDQLEIDLRDPLSIQARENWKVYSAQLISDITLDSIQVTPYTDLVAFGKHPGMAGSIGIAYQTPKVLMALQWKDIGSILWKQGTVFSRSGATSYSGITVPDLLTVNSNVFNSIGDTLRKLTTVNKSPSEYRTTLASNMLAEFHFFASEQWNLGTAINYYFDQNQWRAMAGMDYKLWNFLRLGGQVGYDSSDRINLGLHASLQLAAFNLYLNTDHIQSIYPTDRLKQFSAQVGFALMW